MWEESKVGRKHIISDENSTESIRPALTPEAREDQLIALAVNLAEKQLREGTASSQVITHYLKRDAERKKNDVELQILQKQKELIEAKTESLRAAQSNEELYKNAINAMREYAGNTHGDYEEY